MIFLCVPLITIFYMLGGQINKLFRPIGVPLTIIGLYAIWHNHPLWACLPALAYGFILTLGYGVDSKLMKLIKSEQWVRIILGLLVGVPVILMCVLTQRWIALINVPFIVANSCIRMGSWGKLGKYDILPVDIFRGSALGFAVSSALV